MGDPPAERETPHLENAPDSAGTSPGAQRPGVKIATAVLSALAWAFMGEVPGHVDLRSSDDLLFDRIGQSVGTCPGGRAFLRPPDDLWLVSWGRPVAPQKEVVGLNYLITKFLGVACSLVKTE